MSWYANPNPALTTELALQRAANATRAALRGFTGQQLQQWFITVAVCFNTGVLQQSLRILKAQSATNSKRPIAGWLPRSGIHGSSRAIVGITGCTHLLHHPRASNSHSRPGICHAIRSGSGSSSSSSSGSSSSIRMCRRECGRRGNPTQHLRHLHSGIRTGTVVASFHGNGTHGGAISCGHSSHSPLPCIACHAHTACHNYACFRTRCARSMRNIGSVSSAELLDKPRQDTCGGVAEVLRVGEDVSRHVVAVVIVPPPDPEPRDARHGLGIAPNACGFPGRREVGVHWPRVAKRVRIGGVEPENTCSTCSS